MQKILVPFDGSESAVRALRHAASLAKSNPGMQLEVLHVVEPVPLTSRVSMSQEQVEKMVAEEAESALLPARQLLDQEGVPYQARWRSGTAGEEIAAHLRETGCDTVIMGSRGLGRMASFAVGSFASSVIHHVNVPVTLIK